MLIFRPDHAECPASLRQEFIVRPPPVGQLCAYCDEAILSHDVGFIIPDGNPGGPGELPWHFVCHIRQIVGGSNHIKRRCRCFGGNLPADPPDVSRRQAAELAYLAWWVQQTLATTGGKL